MVSHFAKFHSWYLTLVPVLIGLWKWNKLSRPLKILTVCMILSFLCDFVALYCAKAFKNNILVLNFYGFLSFVLFGMYFRSLSKTLLKSTFWKFYYYIGIVLIGSTIFLLGDPFDRVWFGKTNGYLYIAEMVMVLMVFADMLREVEHKSLNENPHFFICVGIFFHLIGGSVMFFLSHLLSPSDYKILWFIFKTMMQVFMNIMVAYGLYLGQKSLYGK